MKEAKDQIMEVIIWYRDYFLKGGSKENVPGFMDLYNLGLTVIEGQKEIKKDIQELKEQEREIHQLQLSNPRDPKVVEWNNPVYKKLRDKLYKYEKILKLEEIYYSVDEAPKRTPLPPLIPPSEF